MTSSETEKVFGECPVIDKSRIFALRHKERSIKKWILKVGESELDWPPQSPWLWLQSLPLRWTAIPSESLALLRNISGWPRQWCLGWMWVNQVFFLKKANILILSGLKVKRKHRNGDSCFFFYAPPPQKKKWQREHLHPITVSFSVSAQEKMSFSGWGVKMSFLRPLNIILNRSYHFQSVWAKWWDGSIWIICSYIHRTIALRRIQIKWVKCAKSLDPISMQKMLGVKGL